jgi:hypothetical protein
LPARAPRSQPTEVLRIVARSDVLVGPQALSLRQGKSRPRLAVVYTTNQIESVNARLR